MLKHWSTKLRRRVVGVTGFMPDNGATATSFGFTTGPQTKGTWAAGLVFVCSSDELTMLDERVGEMEENQSWEHFSKPKVVSKDTFGTESE